MPEPIPARGATTTPDAAPAHVLVPNGPKLDLLALREPHLYALAQPRPTGLLEGDR